MMESLIMTWYQTAVDCTAPDSAADCGDRTIIRSNSRKIESAEMRLSGHTSTSRVLTFR
jgi:hypothetical protein